MLEVRKLFHVSMRHVTMFAAALACGASLAEQVQTIVPPPVPGARPVTVERTKVHSAAIEGNLEGEPADRDVIVFLPPSYGHDEGRHYPVVYALHGYFIGDDQWTGEIHVPQTVEGAFAQGAAEMMHTSALADRFPELRHAVLQQESLLRGHLPLESKHLWRML